MGAIAASMIHRSHPSFTHSLLLSFPHSLIPLVPSPLHLNKMPTTDTFTFNPDTTQYDPVNAYWLGRAALLAYRDSPEVQSTSARWGFDRFQFFDRNGTQCYLAGNAKMVVAAFRGTQ